MQKLTKEQIKEFKLCEQIIKDNSKTFYKAFSTLKSKADRYAIYAIYAYCRVVDDSIDEYKDLDLLKSYERKLSALKNGNIPDDFIFRSLNEVIKTYYPIKYDFKPYYELIIGQEMDYRFTQPNTLNELLDYCYKVAGVVGEMLGYILAEKKDVDKINRVAINLGEAMQITNILRDIGEDKKRNRIYLPKDVMNKFNYSKDDLYNEVVNENFINTVEYLALYAHDKYQSAIDQIDLFKVDARKPLLLASKFYEAILDSIRMNNYQVFSIRSIVSDETKKEIIKTLL
ncbi:phytoene/squalene synthase family protein [Acholeplasma granularum]|uniref:phytoene/squalene synthase family protein n=1 Tax=Acholeplasma granularum TaxID=264635 RepID=UPI00047073D6|nr:phytoene/squalene synthase family protein [Acholeplasma granularum]